MRTDFDAANLLHVGHAMALELMDIARDAIAASGDKTDGDYYLGLVQRWFGVATRTDGGWIAASARLPTNLDSVLGYVTFGGPARLGHEPMIDIVTYIPTTGEWCQFAGAEGDIPVTVTHWMPLPLSPNEMPSRHVREQHAQPASGVAQSGPVTPADTPDK